MRKSIERPPSRLVIYAVLVLTMFFFCCKMVEALDDSQNLHGNQTFRWPLDPMDSLTLSGSNDFATYNKKQSNYYHTGIDIRSAIFDPYAEVSAGNWTEYITPVKSAADGEVVGIFSTPDSIFRCGGEEIDSSRTYISPSETVNRGLGNVVIIKHSVGVYTLYGHLDCISPEIGIGDFVRQGTIIGKIGHSGTVRRSNASGPHLHFEVKDVIRANPTPDELLGNPIGGIYWGYTPDLPTGYGYHDPREFIDPFPWQSISPVSVRIVAGDNGYLNVRTGPGQSYSKLTRVKAGQKFVAYQESENGSELWHRIYLPNAKGETSGWIAMKHNDCIGNVCAVHDGAAVQVKITKRSKIRSRPDALSESIKVHDKIYDCYRNIYVWKKDRFVVDEPPRRGTGNTKYYRIYFHDPVNPYAPSDTNSKGWVSADCLSVR